MDCCCESVTCTRMTKFARHHEEEKLISLRLDNSIFHTIISQILNMNPLPFFESAYSMVIHEERHILITTSRSARSDAVTFVARSNEKNVNFIQSV